MPESNWADASIAAELERIRLIADLQKEYYEMWGRWPTPTEIRTLMHPV